MLFQVLDQNRSLDILDFPFIPLPEPRFRGEKELVIKCFRMQPTPNEEEASQFKGEVVSMVVKAIMEAGLDFQVARVVSYAWSKLAEKEPGLLEELINEALEKEGAQCRLWGWCGENWNTLVRWDMGYVLYKVLRDSPAK